MTTAVETGHIENVTTFENLINFCAHCAATYNPGEALLKLTALNPQLAAAQTALQHVEATKTAYDIAFNAREIAMTPLRHLAKKIMQALAATQATHQTVDHARSIMMRIDGRGRKPKSIALPNATACTSQENCDKLVDCLAQLITVVTTEPKYLPKENELKVDNLNKLIADMKTKNIAVVNSRTALSNACVHRDKLLYAELTGIVDVAMDVKNYVKSVFGPTSPQFKHVNDLQFTSLKVINKLPTPQTLSLAKA